MTLDPMMAMMMLGGGMDIPGNPMVGGAANNPYGSSGGTGNMARQLGPLRAMSYINRDSRPMGPTPRQGRGAAGGFMPGMGGQDGMDYSQFTFDPQAHDAAQKFLGQYGLSPLDPSQVRQNTVLPNTSFFNNHPRLSGMLEGGIYGAAASHGSNTWGEGIQSVADSLIAGPRMRAAAYNQQFERPFQAAHMLEGLEDASQKRELTEAQIQHTRALTEAVRAKPDPMPHAVTGLPATDSAYITYDDKGQPTVHENPFFDKSGAAKNTPGIAPVLRHIRARYGNIDPDSMSKDQWKKVNQDYANEQVQIGGARTGAEASARIRTSYQLGATVPKEVDNAAKEASKDWWDSKNKTLRSAIRSNAIMSGSSKLLTDDEINQQINEHNAQVNEKIHGVYSDWQNKYNQQNPASPMP